MEEVGEGGGGVGVEGAGDPTGVTEEEGAEEEGFVPGAAFEKPVDGIGAGIKDVVDVNPDAWAEAREDAEEEEGDIAAGFGDVGGVDEEDVVGGQLVEEGGIEGLDGLGEEGDAGVVRLGEERLEALGMGLDAGDGAGGVGFVQGVEGGGGGEAGADFDDFLGLEVLDEAAEEEGVGEGEPAVGLMVKPVWVGLGGEGEAWGLSEEGVVEGFLLGGLEVDVFPVGGGVMGEGGGAGREVIQIEERGVEMAWREAAGAAMGGVGG